MSTLLGRVTTLALAGPLAVAACISSADVHTEADPSARFGEYTTFSWAPRAGPGAGFESGARADEAERAVRPAIDAALEEKGYAERPTGGDLVLRAGAGRREQVVRAVSSLSNAWLPDDERRGYPEGAVVIDVYDARTGLRVWHGSSAAEGNAGALDARAVDRMVSDVLVAFPPAPPRAER